MKRVGTHQGIKIFRAANTHPGCKTTSLAVFNGLVKRFRYSPDDVYGFSKAYTAACNYIDKRLTEPATDTGDK